MPCLRFNGRLRIGFDQRCLQTLPGPADLWIQAASVGEAYLAWELVKNLRFPEQTTILLTSTTSQGLDVLQKISTDNLDSSLNISTAFFPFDKPSLMAKALSTVAPKLLVLLESELWPGLLAGCKKQNVKLVVINGRMTQRSLNSYLRWPAIWREFRPDAILAMSEDDGKRFAALFGGDIVDTMANIKFDRIHPSAEESSQEDNLLSALIPANEAFVVLGSVRQEEEAIIGKLLSFLHEHNTRLTIGLFPRHMHRIAYWHKTLDTLDIPWLLRSQCTTRVEPGTIILWDMMGELEKAYNLAHTAFVGGSLAPVGGQNFLEPISCGIKPAIGPHWKNFAWIGRSIIKQGLVYEAKNWLEVAHYLLKRAQGLPDRQQTQKALTEFVGSRQGGTTMACQKINDMLSSP